MSQQIGQIIGNRYRLTHLISQGGMGKVFVAVDTKNFDRLVAVKLLRQELGDNPAFRAQQYRRFEAEIRVNTLLGQHPRIVTVYDHGLEQDQPYLVMEYLVGEDLRHLMRTEKRLDPARVARLALQICDGLQYAHSFTTQLDTLTIKGVVHRDLKPNNLFVVQDRALGETIKILDFGIAKTLSDMTITLGTQSGFMGTVYYASPEQLQGIKPEPRSDIYSFGIILYEMLTGEMPFTPSTDSFAGWYQAHNFDPPREFPAVFPDIPPAFKDIVMSCLAKDPHYRPASMRQISQELEAIYPTTQFQSAHLQTVPTPVLGPTQPPADEGSFPGPFLLELTTGFLARWQKVRERIRQQRQRLMVVGTGLLVIAFLAVSGLVWSGKLPIPGLRFQTTYDLSTRYAQPEWFSYGDRVLFKDVGDSHRELGVADFQLGNYSDAVKHFKTSVETNRNHPESQIYLNNAKARLSGYPLTLAAIVPVDNFATTALEILRGVADAQTRFNESGGVGNRLLEVLIVNDASDSDQAVQVAQELANNERILGVIGHTAAVACQAVLKALAYEESNLAVVSPTCIESSLSSPVFFKASVTDQQMSESLASYAWKTLGIRKMATFFLPERIGSRLPESYFREAFQQLGGSVTQVDMSQPNFDPKQELQAVVTQQQVKGAVLFSGQGFIPLALSLLKANAQLPNSEQVAMFSSQPLYNPSTLNVGRQGAAGLIVVVPWFAEMREVQIFAQEAETRWGGQINFRTALSFDAAESLIKSLSSQSSRSSVLNNLRRLKLETTDTAGFPLQFTPEGTRVGMNPVLVRVEAVENGQYRFSLVQ